LINWWGGGTLAKKTISICIPVFNEAENIINAVDSIESLFSCELPDYQLEIVITDNASLDSTWEIVRRMADGRSHLRAFRLSRNFGYQNSVFAALSLARGDAAVVLDADLEDPPPVIVEFVRKWEDGFHVVYGIRRRRHTPMHLRILFFVFYRVLSASCALDIPPDAGDFRLLDRLVLKTLTSLPERNLYLRGLVSFLGFRQIGVLYDRQPRRFGVSKFRFLHYVTFAIDGLTAFSKTPLRAIGVVGGGLFGFSVLMGLYYLVGALRSRVPVQGFTTLVLLTLFMHGITFIFLGIIGEYLSRVFDDSKFRPRVIIRDAINETDFPTQL
jgi:dolichol-phosphate mannosyltransferase